MSPVDDPQTSHHFTNQLKLNYPVKYFNSHELDWDSFLYRHTWFPEDELLQFNFGDTLTFPPAPSCSTHSWF